jgi:outer membrane protein, heavy metal efflux system
LAQDATQERAQDAARSEERRLLDDHPEWIAVNATATRAERNVTLATADSRSPVELTIRTHADTPGPGQSTQRGLGVTVRIPFGEGQLVQPKIVSANAELTQAKHVLQRKREQLAMDVANARAARVAADQQVQSERQRAELMRERTALIEKAFTLGEGSLPDLLRAIALSSDAAAAAERAIATQAQARSDLNQALGLLP